MRSREEVALVAELVAEGLSDYEIARQTGIPAPDSPRWRRDRREVPAPFAADPGEGDLPGREYAYVAHECKAGRHRYSVRSAFCNRSEDVKSLFSSSCNALGIRWTSTAKQISVYRKDSVPILDRFIGPKA